MHMEIISLFLQTKWMVLFWMGVLNHNIEAVFYANMSYLNRYWYQQARNLIDSFMIPQFGFWQFLSIHSECFFSANCSQNVSLVEKSRRFLAAMKCFIASQGAIWGFQPITHVTTAPQERNPLTKHHLVFWGKLIILPGCCIAPLVQ